MAWASLAGRRRQAVGLNGVVGLRRVAVNDVERSGCGGQDVESGSLGPGLNDGRKRGGWDTVLDMCVHIPDVALHAL